ncbi:Zn-ribbon domain-containing OB-fold protein [Nocardioides sp. Bht2]|uniref:Zn-ribbon domain-containing OB-fold protein n=1 Tax=Nocardioides sp. Bht2 TaxID=3392297 RepID=UPI0039B44D36
MTETPAVEGWFTTGSEPALIASKCQACGTLAFPKGIDYCRNPACDGEEFVDAELSRTGTVWSYTDAQYQPPAPYTPTTDPYQPFALAAVELPEGIVVLGQLASGYGVDSVKVGSAVELVVEPAWTEEDGTVKTMWKWLPTEASKGAQA